MQTTSKLADKYSDLIMFMHSDAHSASDSQIEERVMRAFDSRVKASEQLILSNAQANKVPSFEGLDFRKKETFKELVSYIEGYFHEKYMPQIVALIKQLKTANTRNAIFQQVFNIMEAKSPLQCLLTSPERHF